MKETLEHTIKVGFKRKPSEIFDEVDSISATMIRKGYTLANSILEESLGNIHLLFEREIKSSTDSPLAGE